MKIPKYSNDTFYRIVATFVQGLFVLIILLLFASNVVKADFFTENQVEQNDGLKTVPITDQASGVTKR